MQFLKSKLLDKFGDHVRHAFTLRSGGVSSGSFASLNLGLTTEDDEENVKKNYKILCKELGLDISKLVLAYQQHTDNVAVIKDSVSDESDDGGHEISPGQILPKASRDQAWPFAKVFSNTDGIITNKVGLTLVTRYADCQGILIFDPVKKVIAAIHAGWRGIAQKIAVKAIKKMAKHFGSKPKDLVVAVGPSIGPRCAKFTDPYKELPKFMHKYVQRRGGSKRGQGDYDLYVDLWRCSSDQLVATGILPENIDIACRCTVCENDKFFFPCGDGKTGHMAGVITLNTAIAS